MNTDPNPSVPAVEQSDPAAAPAQQAGSVPPGIKNDPGAEAANEERKARIKIGTQRPGVLPPRMEPRAKVAFRTPPTPPVPTAITSAAESPATTAAPGVSTAAPLGKGEEKPQPPKQERGADEIRIQRKPGPLKPKFEVSPAPGSAVEPPNLRAALSPELEEELAQALGDTTLDELIAAETGGPAPPESLEPESRHKGRVIRIFRDDVFVEIGGRNQGILPLHAFTEEAKLGDEIEVVVVKFNSEDGFYELTLVGGSVQVGDWADVSEGIVVDARITGHNKGGLECEVGKIRGFIPAGQVSIYRVENFEEFVGQSWPCVVTEANPQRRNLVLSRRAVLEREQAEAKKQLLTELQVGDVREGVVRSLRDFGAFVDLGGVDGMIHVSQMSWDRVKHPSEVLTMGQRVKVKILKIDPDTHKISLAYRDLFESPWANAASKYPVTKKVTGTVSKIMDFGAFVKLEPGIEGLVHISELSHKRVFRTGEVVKVGQQIEAKVLSVDPDNQRISLSMKALEAHQGMSAETDEDRDQDSQAAAAESESSKAAKKKRQEVLKGGLGRSPRGDQFGLKW